MAILATAWLLVFSVVTDDSLLKSVTTTVAVYVRELHRGNVCPIPDALVKITVYVTQVFFKSPKI